MNEKELKAKAKEREQWKRGTMTSSDWRWLGKVMVEKVVEPTEAEDDLHLGPREWVIMIVGTIVTLICLYLMIKYLIPANIG